ncbi:5420_t:CDS:2, partial [Entrophospora sp. SA101]
MSLLRAKLYSVELGATHNANKIQRNSSSIATRHGLIPDMTVIYKKREVEIAVVESSKSKLTDDIAKNEGDKIKLAVLMHDQLTTIHDELAKEEKESEIRKIEVYGICTS